jgi:hypothetical protein
MYILNKKDINGNICQVGRFISLDDIAIYLDYPIEIIMNLYNDKFHYLNRIYQIIYQ